MFIKYVNWITFAPYPGGGIGRHASLRGWCSLGHAGSSPVLGTKTKKPHLAVFLFAIKLNP